MRDGHDIAIAISFEALGSELAPQLGDRTIGLEDGNGQTRHLLAFEDDIAMQIRHLLSLRILVADKGCETAVVRPIVMSLCRCLNVIPGRERAGLAIAQRAHHAALRSFTFHTTGDGPEARGVKLHPKVLRARHNADRRPPTRLGPVTVTECNLTQELTVIGYRSKIDGAINLR